MKPEGLFEGQSDVRTIKGETLLAISSRIFDVDVDDAAKMTKKHTNERTNGY